MAQTIYIPSKLNTSDAEHDDTNDAKRVNIVAGSISIDPGDIQIGAVEIKDGDSDLRADVATDGNGDNRLLVDAGVTSVDPNDVVTASTHNTNDDVKASYTAPVGKELFITSIWASTRTADIIAQLQEDGTAVVDIPVSSGANSFASLVLPTETPYGPYTAGTVIEIERVEGLAGFTWSAGCWLQVHYHHLI